jgi:pyruvate dehydrogenase E1 component alpha subunit/2-oxoisovalerate dehydrogenase E1 component alpha subunit
VCPPEDLPTDLFSRLDPEGVLHGEPSLPLEEALAIYRHMLRQRLIDERMLTLQRQGRIGFYGACTGQEASVFGTAAAAQPTDWIVPALREAGILLYRGLPLRTYFRQLLGNVDDITQGRQMPCHPPGGGFHYITMSSVIANHLPQANGLALAGKIRRDGRVTLAYMGDGATSEGDFHVALNVAAVQRLPVVWICQNNQWSISVPVGRQTAAASIASRAKGYGIPGVRVDGNDLFAVHEATREAIERARSGGGPTLVECLTYRLGAHTTSDDPSRYRDEAVTQRWWGLDPLVRLRRLFTVRGLWDDAREEEVRAAVDAEIRGTWAEVEGAEAPPPESILHDVFAEPTPQLREQRARLLRSIEKGAGASGHG